MGYLLPHYPVPDRYLPVIGTFLLVSLFGGISSGLDTLDMSPMANTLYASLGGFIGLTLFTYALGPVSGAHLSMCL
jgi:hypothetical protein